MTGTLTDQPVAQHTTRLTRRDFLLGSAATVSGFTLYSAEIARHEVSTVSRTIAIDRLPDAFHNFRIVQISDLHFEEFTEPAFLRHILTRVNALAPDLVLLTGDFISFGPLPLSFAAGALYRCTDLLRGLACPQRYAVMGNHDTSLGVGIVTDALDHASIPLLYNSYTPIERDGQRLWLAGVADPVSSHPDLHRAIPAHPDGPILLMAHGPDFADEVAYHPRGHLVDFMVSGHSHGGQIRLPLYGPLILPTGGRKYVEGLFRIDHLQLYVNRGLGTVGLPLRLNCPPEITMFTLKSSGEVST